MGHFYPVALASTLLPTHPAHVHIISAWIKDINHLKNGILSFNSKNVHLGVQRKGQKVLQFVHQIRLRSRLCLFLGPFHWAWPQRALVSSFVKEGRSYLPTPL